MNTILCESHLRIAHTLNINKFTVVPFYQYWRRQDDFSTAIVPTFLVKTLIKASFESQVLIESANVRFKLQKNQRY